MFADKGTEHSGILKHDRTLNELLADAESLKDYGLGAGMYVADVEAYLVGRSERYAAQWREGAGGGKNQLVVGDTKTFAATFAARKATQELINIEVFRHKGKLTYLGVFRAKPAGLVGASGLLFGLTWEQLATRKSEFAPTAYLADFEPYVDDGKRRFVGVWRIGAGSGALYRHNDAAEFQKLKIATDATQQLIDYERYGTWQVGVWRSGTPGRFRSGDRPWETFFPFWQGQVANVTMIDFERFSTLAHQVYTRE